MHYRSPIRKWKSGKSFSSVIPLWIELSNPKGFFDYFKDKFESEDVMLILNDDDWSTPPNLNEIEDFCAEKKWRCATDENVKGSEASVTILYDLNKFRYEFFTRAKTQLVIVTFDGKRRYFFFNFNVVLFSKMIYSSF